MLPSNFSNQKKEQTQDRALSAHGNYFVTDVSLSLLNRKTFNILASNFTEVIFLPKKDIKWDLSEMFLSITHPSIQKAIDSLEKVAEHFAEKYQGKIAKFVR